MTISLVPDSPTGVFPNQPPSQTWKGILGRGRIALSDGAGTDLTSTLVGADQALDVNVIQTVGGGGSADPVGLKNIALATIDPAIEGKQDTMITSLGSIDGKDFATQVTLAAILAGQLADSHNVTVDNASIAITAASLPLPSGAATAALQLADDHNVKVTDIIPGTGATNLGKAEDAVHTTGDTGVAMLGIRRSDIEPASSGADGDYTGLNIDGKGRLRVSPGGLHILDPMFSTTGWAVINDDAGNLATTTNHVTGPLALTFDKLNGSSDTVFALIEKTITSVNLNAVATGALFFQSTVLLPDMSDTVNVVLRMGTDSSNYNEWKISTEDSNAGVFELFRTTLANSTGSTGNGWDLTAVTWLSVGVEFSGQSNTLAGIIFDNFSVTAGQVNSSDTGSDITTAINTGNVNLQKIGGSVVTKGPGNASNGSQRITIADDDTNLAAINAGQLVDGHNVTVDNASIAVTGTFFQATQPVSGTFFQATQPVSAAALPLPSGASTSAAQLPDGHNVTVDNASIAITAASLPLPAGAATSALQLADGHNVTVDNTAGSNPIPMVGNITNGTADSGAPVKAGVRTTDLKPLDGVEVGLPAQDADDRANLQGSLRGALTVHPLPYFESLTDIDDTYDNTTTSNNSAAVETWKYRFCTIGLSIVSAGVSTHEIEIVVQGSDDGSTGWQAIRNGALGQWIYDDTYLSSLVGVRYTFPAASMYMRVRIIGTNTTASNTFTVTNAVMHLRT